MQTGFVEAIRAAGEHHAIAGLLPDRGARRRGRSAAGRADRPSRLAACPRPALRRGRPAAGTRCRRRDGREQVLAGQAARPANDPPSGQRLLQIACGARCGGRGRNPSPSRSPAAAPAAAAGRAGHRLRLDEFLRRRNRSARDWRQRCSAAPPSGRRWICRRRRAPGHKAIAASRRCSSGIGFCSSDASRRSSHEIACRPSARSGSGGGAVSAGT